MKCSYYYIYNVYVLKCIWGKLQQNKRHCPLIYRAQEFQLASSYSFFCPFPFPQSILSFSCHPLYSVKQIYTQAPAGIGTGGEGVAINYEQLGGHGMASSKKGVRDFSPGRFVKTWCYETYFNVIWQLIRMIYCASRSTITKYGNSFVTNYQGTVQLHLILFH